jgi:hypothetical protein
MPHRSNLSRTTTSCSLLVALFVFTVANVIPESSAQDIIFTTVVDDGDPINSPGADPSSTVSSINSAQWSDEALGVHTRDSLSRSYSGFWYPSVGEVEYVAGTNYPFSDFEPIFPTTNREGNPPVAPRLSSAGGNVNNSDEFFMQVYVDDGGTFLVESWPTLITAGPGTGIQQFAQRFITPVAMAATEYAFYVTGVDLEDNHGWLQADGSVQILIDSDTPVPSELNNATHFFWSNPSKILNNRTSIHIAGYNGSPGGNAIYTMSPSGAIDILVDSNGDVPIDVNLPAGGNWGTTIGPISVNDSGRILFYAGVSKLGEFSRKALWSMATNSGEPTLEVSTLVPYETNTVATVTFDSVNAGVIDNAGNILFQARVDGESAVGVWRKLVSGKFVRITPPIDSPLPGLPDFTTRASSIVDMNTDGRCVIQIQAIGSRSISAYFLESTKESLIYILAEGVPFGPDEESISVTSVDLSETAILAMLLRVDVPNTFDDDDRLVIARDPNDVQPSGNKYVWDGGAGTSNWHTVANGRTNWVDASGVPWDVAPNSEDAQIEIGIDAVVQIDQGIQVFSINLLKGSLELNASVLCHGVIYVQEDASLILQGFELDAKLIISEGLILKEGDKTASLTGEKLSIDQSEFVVEGGLLRLWCDTKLEDSTLRIEGGTVNARTLSFEGNDPRIEVADGATLEIVSPNLTFKSDTTISTEDGGSIKIGDSENESTITTNFETDFPEERRVLEFIGKGDIELFDPLNIPSNAIVRNKSGFGIEAGLVIDTYEGDNLEEINIEGLFENTGVIAVKGGGLEGNFRNLGWLEATPRQTGDLPIILDGENRGTVYLNARGLAYNDLTFGSGSKLILKDGVFKSIFPASELTEKTLVFEQGSSIDAVSGNWTIQFQSFDAFNFGPKLEIDNSATIEIQKANTLAINDLVVSSTGILDIIDLKFHKLSIQSEGVVNLSGAIEGDPEIDTLEIIAHSFSIKDTTIQGRLDLNDPSLIRFGKRSNTPIAEPQHIGSIENVVFENSMDVLVDETSQVVISGTTSTASRISVLGKAILTTSIADTSDYAAFILGSDNIKGHLEISSLPSEPLTIGPIVFLWNEESTITAAENTTASFDVGFIDAREPIEFLETGNWIVEDFASLQINNLPQVKEISKKASVTLNKPHPTLGSLSDLPNPTESLVNLGTLKIQQSVLDMGGKIFRQKGTFEGKVIGNVESVRDDVQGVIQLVGDIDIQGNLTMDTTLSLGASPGTGKISGDLTLLPGAEMIIEIGGSDPGTEFDFLEVGGTTSLDGTLHLSLTGEYIPEVDETFLFLKTPSVSGSFAEIDQTETGRQRRFDLSSGAEGLTLNATEITIGNYEQWRSYFFNEADAANELISGHTADPDLDGLANLSEYLHATLPQQGNPPSFSFDLSNDSNLVTQVQWAKNVLDYEWKLETSTDLEQWETIQFTSQPIEDFDDKAEYRIQFPSTNANAREVFYQFKAVKSE